jgi:GTP cyclohydrolase I
MAEEREQTETVAAARYLRAMLEEMGLTGERDGHLSRTPENVAEFWAEFFAPWLAELPPPAVSTFPADEMAGQLVLLRDLRFHSMCAHHLTPFFGHAHIAYVPDRVAMGIGGPAKLLEFYSRRPQLQERLVAQLADALEHICAPRGVMVVLTARQMCMEMRGAKADGTVECVLSRGCFTETGWRETFFSRLGAIR